MSDTATATRWSIEWRGSTWDSADLTGEHAAAVAEMLGIAPPWDWFDPTDLHPALGPLQVMVLIAAFVVVEQGVQGTPARMAVLDAIKETSVDELVDAIQLTEG